MNPSSSILYLLAGNGSTAEWWRDALPYFIKWQPMPLELPGFGDNPSHRYGRLEDLAEALLEMTFPGQRIFAVGINGLVVLHALVRKPNHFKKVILLAPVGAFLWERPFARVMRFKLVRKLIHWLLSRYPKLFRKKFTDKEWSDETYQRIANGYRKCRAFQPYFEMVEPYSALDLFEWITTPIDLIWGRSDGVLGAQQAAAWDSILPRADLTVTIHETWGHYPYLDDPEGFARELESFKGGFPAHTKAGRLKLAELAGLPVPKQISVTSAQEIESALDQLSTEQTYAVRSSGAEEDHIDHSHAGRNDTFLRISHSEIQKYATILLNQKKLASAVIQHFIEPMVSGVAFCRWISMEIEYVSGHMEDYISGKVTPYRAIMAKMNGEWASPPEPLPDHSDFPFDQLEAFLRQCLQAFHYHPSDIEWAWDGRQFYLLQLRPVTTYDWRRCLTSANLDELLPSKVSRIMEHGQRRAALSIGRLYAIWDPQVLNDHEPFTAISEDASYINADLILSRLYSWGMPSQILASEIGGAVPTFGFNLFRFLRSLPVLLRMHFLARRRIRAIENGLEHFEQELSEISEHESSSNREDALAQWFVRYYVFIVQSNVIINACITTSGGSFLGKPKTVYGDLKHTESLHRLAYESDPATPRQEGKPPELEPFPRWGIFTRLLNRLGVIGLGGRYFELREWFRDNNMRLFFRLHHVLKGSEWLLPHPGSRDKKGTFWQSGGDTIQQGFSFVIYPGKATGEIGKEILIVDALEPGHYEDYKKAEAVIARTGGRLSHGATLLRELQKPSAVIQEAPADLSEGTKVTYDNGTLSVQESFSESGE